MCGNVVWHKNAPRVKVPYILKTYLNSIVSNIVMLPDIALILFAQDLIE